MDTIVEFLGTDHGACDEVMRREHEQMRDLLSAMEGAVNAADDAAFGLAETLNMLMQQHNIKEESMLYPMSDRRLGARVAELIRNMDAVAR